MLTYQKVCPMCQSTFFSIKINTIWCSRKCRNKSRSLPEKLKAELVRRNSAFMISATRFTKMVKHTSSLDMGVDLGENSTPTEKELQDLELLVRTKQRAQEPLPVRSQPKEVFGMTAIEKEKPQANKKLDPFVVPVEDIEEVPDEDDNIDSMSDALEPCPDCGSNHHKSCNIQNIRIDNLQLQTKPKRTFGGGLK